VPATSTGALSPRERVERVRWYHTIDLGDGLVTPGWFDTRAAAHKVPLPASLAGLRCLDVGTWDGFWAFEMERRGAASVTALDIFDMERWDWPPRARLTREKEVGRQVMEEFREEGAGFRLAHELLGSAVERIDLSVYELSPERVGTFDVVFLGTLLMHLRDPVAALDAVRSVCRGEAVFADTVDAIPSVLRPRTPTARLEGLDRPWWWVPNRAGLHQMVRSAGFDIVEATGLYLLPLGPAHPRQPLRSLPRHLLSAEGREKLALGLRGMAHAAVRARPLAAAA
jgi:tRNA (mo5U34)-methyltransferase